MEQRGMLRIWRCDCALSSLETSFHAANHTIPPPPSYEGLPRCPKDKKPLAVSRRKNPDDKMISWKEVTPFTVW
ncbi:MAG: hypothetical protein SOX13_07390 [Sodaliphilus sp.]|nr:hypothetical protein [Sodaliphilus sp.]